MPAAAPKSLVRGRLYLASNHTSEAAAIFKAVDFNIDHGLQNEDVKYAGASVTTTLGLLSAPSIAVNYLRDTGQSIITDAIRWWRDNGTGVKFYLYLDITGEALIYAYGYAALEGTSLQGAADAGIRGSLTLRPGPEDVWDDHFITG